MRETVVFLFENIQKLIRDLRPMSQYHELEALEFSANGTLVVWIPGIP